MWTTFSPSTGRAISRLIPILSALISKRPAWTATFTASRRSARYAWKNGVVTKSFQTFVDPGMPIPPEIVQLTGITDRDVYGAPGEAEAVRAFLDFVGDLPLVAHNAAFDIGFITAAAKRSGLAFDPVYIDTLPIAQALLKQLKNSSSTSSPTRWACRTLTTTARVTMPPCAPASSQPFARGSRTRAQNALGCRSARGGAAQKRRPPPASHHAARAEQGGTEKSLRAHLQIASGALQRKAPSSRRAF